MKNLLLKVSLSALITLSTLHAEIKTSIMEEMLDSVNLIQLGILTNTNAMVQEGVSQIKVSSKQLSAVDHSKYLYFDQIKSFKYTKEKASKISIHATKITTYFEAKDTANAHKEYALLIDQCIECHNKLRDYKDRGEGYRKNLKKLP